MSTISDSWVIGDINSNSDDCEVALERGRGLSDFDDLSDSPLSVFFTDDFLPKFSKNWEALEANVPILGVLTPAESGGQDESHVVRDGFLCHIWAV